MSLMWAEPWMRIKSAHGPDLIQTEVNSKIPCDMKDTGVNLSLIPRSSEIAPSISVTALPL